MILLRSNHPWEIAAGLTAVAAAGGIGLWFAMRKRPTAEELEVARRNFLVQSGRIVDGMLLDVCPVEIPDGRTLTMLLYNYRNGGVDYECSQDVSLLLDVVDVTQIRAGFPCSIRYQPGNPQNSIVVAERWSGLRRSLPQFPHAEDLNPIDISHLQEGSSHQERAR